MYLRYHDMIAICIFQFHVFYIAKIALWIKLKGMWPSYKEASKNDGDNVAAQIINPSHDQYKIVTRTVLEIREPLLDS